MDWYFFKLMIDNCKNVNEMIKKIVNKMKEYKN